MGRVRTLPRQLLAGAIAQVKRRFNQLKGRYGPQYTKAMLGAAFGGLFLPIPGGVIVAVALIAMIAEVHRVISRRSGLQDTARYGSWPPDPLADRRADSLSSQS
jgi:hypothetical protein